LLIHQTCHSLNLRRPPRILVDPHKSREYRKVAVAQIIDTPLNRGLLNNALWMKIFRLLPVVGARRSHYELAVFAHDTSADEGDEVESTMLISTEVAHGKMQWQCSMSLDGFIAGPGGDM